MFNNYLFLKKIIEKFKIDIHVISFSHSTMNIQKVYKLDDKMMKVVSRMCKIFLLLDDKNLIPLGKKHL